MASCGLFTSFVFQIKYSMLGKMDTEGHGLGSS